VNLSRDRHAAARPHTPSNEARVLPAFVPPDGILVGIRGLADGAYPLRGQPLDARDVFLVHLVFWGGVKQAV